MRGGLFLFAAWITALAQSGCSSEEDAPGGGDPTAEGSPATQQEAELPPGPETGGSKEGGELSWSAEQAEEFQVAAAEQLRTLFQKLGAGAGRDDLLPLVAIPKSCVLNFLRPRLTDDEIRFELGGVKVYRWSGPAPASPTLPITEAYSELADAWPEGAEPRIKVKHFAVEPTADRTAIRTRTNVYTFAHGTGRSVQQSSEWECLWTPSGGTGAVPKLISVQLVDYEEVRSDLERPLLADVTSRWLGNLAASDDLLTRDANYWITRRPRLKHRFQHGIAIADVNGDGLEDIYLCQPEAIPNLLLLRRPGGMVEEAAAEHGLDFLDNTTSAILADFDNDGDQDLAVAFRSRFKFFENTGSKFEPRSGLPQLGQIFSLAAADYDADGLLDLFVCRYQNLDELGRAPSAIPLHDANNGGANTLLKNLGNWEFADATEESGLGQNNTRWSVAASWEDYDRDGDLDLYVANDYGRNNLYRCDTASDGSVSFSDIAPEVGVEDMTTSMGVSWGDPNRDGAPDIYVSNMYSSAGRRITFQKNFKRNIAGSDEAHVRAWQNASLGNSLFQGRAGKTFTHTSAQARIQNGQWSWGSVFADINHDGWEDLLVANGFITGPSEAEDL